MPVISFVSSKGGVGKTTGAVVLAGELADAGRTVRMVDADPNQPLLIWQKVRALPRAISIVADESAETIIDTIDAGRGAADYVIVDLEGTATDRVGFAVTRSDLVLIPVQGSTYLTSSTSRRSRQRSAKRRRAISKTSSPMLACRPFLFPLLIEPRSGRSLALVERFTRSRSPTLVASKLRARMPSPSHKPS
jgi:chromosome partitioning protein